MTPTDPPDAVCDAVYRFLSDFGVRPGDPPARRAMAQRADKGGITHADVELLTRWFCELERKGTAQDLGAVIATVMTSKRKWAPLLADVRNILEKRQLRREQQANTEGQRNRMLSKPSDKAAARNMTEEEFEIYEWERGVCYRYFYDNGSMGESGALLDTAAYFHTTEDRVKECLRKHPNIGEARGETTP